MRGLKIAAACFIAAACIAFIEGCQTPPQRVAFNTIASVETTGTAAFDAYAGLVLTGKVPTNGLPATAREFNTFQQSVTLSLTLLQNDTNALAPTSLQNELTQLLNIINTAKGGH